MEGVVKTMTVESIQPKEWERLLNSSIVARAAKVGAAEVMRLLPTNVSSQKEGIGNYVTEADKASEAAIRAFLAEHAPQAVFISEETDLPAGMKMEDILTLPDCFIVDPVDGTANLKFRSEFGYFCVAVAHVKNGEIQEAAAYAPVLNRFYYAKKGKGAYCNGQRLSVQAEGYLSKTLVANGSPYSLENTFRNLELLRIAQPLKNEMLGSGVLMMSEVAQGSLGLFFQSEIWPWDNATGFLMVEEAGGIIRNLAGKEITFLSPDIVVGNRPLVEEFLARINREN